MLTTDEATQAKIRAEMTQVQRELKEALEELLRQVGKRLSPAELVEIKAEFAELDLLLERVKSGFVWIALFGRTSAGKSSVVNSLMGADVAKVGVQFDVTDKAYVYEKRPWKLIDIPGIMGKKVNEELAVTEAKRALGHVFVIEGEPFADELELFDVVHHATPDTQKIVLFNKWDEFEGRKPPEDVATIRRLAEAKMRKYVRSEADIIYGSARLYDPATRTWQRQELPQLLDRLYAGAGTLGQVVNVIDPANRAADLMSGISAKVLEVRVRIARRVINVFGLASVAGGFVPFDTLTVQPGLLASQVAVISVILGKKPKGKDIFFTSKELLKTCGLFMAADFAAITAADIVSSAASVFFPPFFWLFGMAEVAALGYLRYKRSVIFGEVALEYIKRDFSWGGEEPRAVMMCCKERAHQHYAKLRSAGDSFEQASRAARRS